MTDKINSIVPSISPMSQGSMSKLHKLIQYVNVKKGELITNTGKNNSLEYFLINGICKSFLYSPEGDDITISFFMSGSIFSPSTTRNKAGKSIMNIRALTDVEIATIDADQFEQLMIENID